MTRRSCEKWFKDIKISGYYINALIDSGSDISLIRASQYVKIGAPPLRRGEILFRGIGSSQSTTLGQFTETVIIDGEAYSILINVIPDNIMTCDLLIGADFLNGVNLSVREGKILMSRPKVQDALKSDLPEIFMIEDIRKESRIDVSHIEDSGHRSELVNIVASYKPLRTREPEMKMKIIVRDEEPVYQRPRRLSASEKEIVNKQIDAWLKAGIIRPSLSEYASPIVLVKKKNGTTRLCVNYRQINKKIIKDRYPLPLIEDQLTSLQAAKVFSTLDLENGFFHLPIEKEIQKYTAFVVPDAHYEFLKVPFGLCNFPAVFQRYVNVLFRDLIAAKIALVYMDDVIIPSIDIISGLRALRDVLNITSQHGLLINWKKIGSYSQKLNIWGTSYAMDLFIPQSIRRKLL